MFNLLKKKEKREDYKVVSINIIYHKKRQNKILKILTILLQLVEKYSIEDVTETE